MEMSIDLHGQAHEMGPAAVADGVLAEIARDGATGSAPTVMENGDEPPLRLSDLTIPLCFIDADGVICWTNPSFRGLSSAATDGARPGARLDSLIDPADHGRLAIAAAHPVEVRFLEAGSGGHRYELRPLARLPVDSPRGRAFTLLTASDTEGWHADRELWDALRLELGHRLRNLVMIVTVLVNDTVGAHHDAAAVSRLLDRLRSLHTAGYVGDEVFETNCSVARIARRILDRFHDPLDGRVLIDGPDVSISRRWGNTLALALHELATNSVKYGSLSSRAGVVSLRWCPVEQSVPILHLEWREIGGPEVREPSQLGQGLTFVKKVLSRGRGAGASFRFASTGFVSQLDVPIGQSISHGGRLP